MIIVTQTYFATQITHFATQIYAVFKVGLAYVYYTFQSYRLIFIDKSHANFTFDFTQCMNNKKAYYLYL